MTYYNRRLIAVTHPQLFLSMIIDGADQQAYGLPHFSVKSKTTEMMHKLPLHLMGAIVHGIGNYGFSYLPNIKGGNNVTIEGLHRLKKARGFLPRVLYVQLDNTSKQCKGRFLLGYLKLVYSTQCSCPSSLWATRMRISVHTTNKNRINPSIKQSQKKNKQRAQ